MRRVATLTDQLKRGPLPKVLFAFPNPADPVSTA